MPVCRKGDTIMTRALWTRNVTLMLALAALSMRPEAAVQKFYPDDPLEHEIDDRDASHVRTADVNHTVSGWQAIRGTGDRSSRRAMNVNTVDEVPDSSWFTNRIGWRRLSHAYID